MEQNLNDHPMDKLDKMFTEVKNNNSNKGEKKMENDNHSNGNLNIEIEELQIKGITLKGLKAHGDITITDENVKVQCDAVLRLIGSLLGEFGSHLCSMLDTHTKYQEQHMHDDREYHVARVNREQAQTEYYKAQRKHEETSEEKVRFELEQLRIGASLKNK